MASTETLISFLQQPGSYPHQPQEVEIRQTHGSILAIVPPYVYKVKKSIDLGFMNFTSLAARKTNSERELYLNSRLCPDMYLAVVPVYGKEGRLSFTEGGEIAEYALQMKMLPDGFFLHQLLQKGTVTPQTLEPVLARLAEFYQSQAAIPAIARYGELQALKQNTDDNFTTLQHFTGGIMQPAGLEIIKKYTNAFYTDHQRLLEKRIRENKIKDCHGDLHAEHIHIYHNTIHIYDCIEFNDRFRYIDVAADIAFLAMDLDFHRRADLSAYVADRMAALLADPDMPLLMDFYKCYRACVRAKVEAIKSAEPEVTDADRQQSRERAIKYLQLALRYALFGSKAVVLVVCGRIGSGKSTVATGMAELLGFEYVSSDIVRKQKAGIPLFERTPPEKKQWLYSAAITGEVYRQLLDTTVAGTAGGAGLVVDATFSQPSYRAMFVTALAEKNIPCYFIEAQASDQVIQARLAKREKSEAIVSDARLEDFTSLASSYQPIQEVPGDHLIRVSTEQSPEATLAAVLMKIANSSRLA
jgi:uncharacterized protein